MKTRITIAAILCVLFAMAAPVTAQVSITGNGNYTQNFDGLIMTGTTPWVDNSTVVHWWASRAVGTNTLNAGGGGSTTGGLWSYGKNSSSDRALGSLGSGSTGSIAYGVQFQNNTTSTITDVTVAYIGEQWRKGGTLTAQTDSVWYMVSPTLITSVSPGINTGWTRVALLDFSSPVSSTGGAALNGDTIGNRTKFSAQSLPGLSVPAGSYLMIKWDDADHSGADDGLAIDSVEVTWIIPPPDVIPPVAIDAWATSNSHVVVAFDEPLDATSAETAGNYTWAFGTVTGTATLRPTNDTIDLTLSTPLTGGVLDTLYVCCISDALSNAMTSIYKFEIISTNLDNTPPAAIDAWANDLTNVTVVFDEPLEVMYAVDPTNYTWLNANTGSVTIRPTQDTVDLVLNVPLQSGVTDTLFVTGLNDTALNTMTQVYKFPINIVYLDVIPPVVIDAYATALNHVVVAFDEPLEPMYALDETNYTFLQAIVQANTGATLRPTHDTIDLVLSTPLLLGITDSITVCCVTDTAFNNIVTPYVFPITFGAMPVDTLVYWVFPTVGPDTIADGGIFANLGRTITREPAFTGQIDYVGGVTSEAARTLKWDLGNGTKYWVVSFTTAGYDSIQFSSRQRSSPTGPRDFKVEYSTDNFFWFDVNGTAIQVRDNFTNGALSNVHLPVFVNNQANVWLRWIMTSDSAVGAGNLVANTGSSRIDDILVYGRLNPLVNVTNAKADNSKINIYPNPNTGNFRIDFSQEAQRNDIMILSATGSMIYRETATNSSVDVDLSSYGKGLYFIRISDMTTGKITVKKVVVE